MLFNFHLYLRTFFRFASWYGVPSLIRRQDRFDLTKFSYRVRLFGVENLEESRLFNYFYLARYFLGTAAKVYYLNKYFVLGRYYNDTEIGFQLPATRAHGPLAIWVFQLQPLVNLRLSRDYTITRSKLHWLLRDPSIFSERKTNTGLFYLADPLSFFLSYRECQGASRFFTHKMLSSLKLILK